MEDNRTQTRVLTFMASGMQACTGRKSAVMRIWAYDDFGHLKEAKGRLYLYLPKSSGRTGRLLEKTRNGKVVLTCTYYPEAP